MPGVWEAAFKSVLTIAAIGPGCSQDVALGNPQKGNYWCLWRSCYLSPLHTRFLFFKLVWEIWACSPTSQWLRPLPVAPGGWPCEMLSLNPQPPWQCLYRRTEKNWTLWKGLWGVGAEATPSFWTDPSPDWPWEALWMSEDNSQGGSESTPGSPQPHSAGAFF